MTHDLHEPAYGSTRDSFIDRVATKEHFCYHLPTPNNPNKFLGHTHLIQETISTLRRNLTNTSQHLNASYTLECLLNNLQQ